MYELYLKYLNMIAITASDQDERLTGKEVNRVIATPNVGPIRNAVKETNGYLLCARINMERCISSKNCMEKFVFHFFRERT